MRLQYQLFLTLLLSSVVLIALLAAFNSWSLNQGFSDYVVENEKQRLLPVIGDIAEIYGRKKNWQWVEEQPELLRRVLRDARNQGQASNIGSDKSRPRPRNSNRQRLLLIDANRELLMGRELPSSDVVWQPITLDSTVIGYLGIREPRDLPGELEKAFVSQQLKSYGYAALAMVVFSALLALALASRIVKPILTINSAVKSLTGGRYQSRINARRKDELGVLSADIDQLAYTLESTQNARQQWMAEISHELRTPVAVLQGELEAIQDGVHRPDAAAINSLHAEALHLGRLIHDLHELTLSDVGAMAYHMEATDVAQVLEQRLALGKSQLEAARLSISLNTSDAVSTIQADAQRLAQLFDNLLQNSIRYTDEGGRIDVKLSHQAAYVIIDWQDSAPGVSDDQLPHLFNLFYRAEQSRNRASGGSGLGLTIVRKIVLAHQGQIEATASNIGGLHIRVQFPS